MSQPSVPPSNQAGAQSSGEVALPASGPAEPISGLALFAAALLLLIVIGSVSQRYRPGPQGIALTEFVAILLPAVIFLELGLQSKSGARDGGGQRRQAVLRFLRLTPVTLWLPVGLLGGLLLGGGVFYLMAVWLEPLLEHLVPVPPGEHEQLLRLLRPATGMRPLWQDLLCFAAVPAICEEVLFRGAILSTLGSPLGWRPETQPASEDAGSARRSAMMAVVLCALLFGIFHLSWSKILPTTMLGIGFGAAAVWGRSLWPAIAMHCANNALVVILIRAGLDEPPRSARLLFSDGAHHLHPGPGLLWVAAALSASLLGYWLLRLSARHQRSRRRAQEVD